MLIGAIVVITLLIIGATLLLLWPLIAKKIDCKRFLLAMGKRTYAIARDSDFYLLNKVTIPIDDGKEVHFDHIIFGDKYIYVIGDAYYPGPLSGKYRDQQWFLYNENIHFTHIKNPLTLHHTRLNYLSLETTAPMELFVGILVVNDSCFLDNIPGIPQNEFICNESDLKNIIARKEKEDVSIINPISLNNLVHNINNLSKK